MKYLVITEDGTIYQSDTIGDDEKEGCNTGILDVIDTEAVPMVQYAEGEWHELDTWGDTK